MLSFSHRIQVKSANSSSLQLCLCHWAPKQASAEHKLSLLQIGKGEFIMIPLTSYIFFCGNISNIVYAMWVYCIYCSGDWVKGALGSFGILVWKKWVRILHLSELLYQGKKGIVINTKM